MPQSESNLSLYFASSHPLNFPKMVTSKGKHKEVITLHIAAHDLPFIANQTGVQLRTIQYLVRRFKDAKETAALASLPKPRRPHKMTLRTRALISWQVLKDPRLTAREVKVKNIQLLGDVSLRSVQQMLHDDLGY